MSSFPLYDDLLKKLPKSRAITRAQKTAFLAYVDRMDTTAQEYVYVLIRHHYALERLDYTSVVHVQPTGVGVVVDFDHLQPVVQKMLVAFVKQHDERSSAKRLVVIPPVTSVSGSAGMYHHRTSDDMPISPVSNRGCSMNDSDSCASD